MNARVWYPASALDKRATLSLPLLRVVVDGRTNIFVSFGMVYCEFFSHIFFACFCQSRRGTGGRKHDT